MKMLDTEFHLQYGAAAMQGLVCNSGFVYRGNIFRTRLHCAEAITTKALRKMNVSSVSMEDLENEFDQAEQTVLSSYADALSGGSELMMTMPALADSGVALQPLHELEVGAQQKSTCSFDQHRTHRPCCSESRHALSRRQDGYCAVVVDEMHERHSMNQILPGCPVNL